MHRIKALSSCPSRPRAQRQHKRPTPDCIIAFYLNANNSNNNSSSNNNQQSNPTNRETYKVFAFALIMLPSRATRIAEICGQIMMRRARKAVEWGVAGVACTSRSRSRSRQGLGQDCKILRMAIKKSGRPLRRALKYDSSMDCILFCKYPVICQLLQKGFITAGNCYVRSRERWQIRLKLQR